MLPEQLRLTDGTIVRRCPTDKPLYCSRAGKFYNAAGQELKPCFSPGMQSNKPYTHGGAYPCMRHFGCRLCHHLIWETFVGPRKKGMEIDHINGNKLDWSIDNLEEVTPEENRRRAKILRAMRAAGLNPATYTREELLHIFAKYEIEEQ